MWGLPPRFARHPESALWAPEQGLKAARYWLYAVRTDLGEVGIAMVVADRDTLNQLTPTQQRIVDLMADGHAPKQVARALGITLDTVRSHLKSAKRRTESRTLAELVANHGHDSDQRLRPLHSGLTTRQLEVVWHLANGKAFAEIGTALGISPRTVGMHVAAAKERLGLTTTSQLVVVVSLGNPPPPPQQSPRPIENAPPIEDTSSTVVAPVRSKHLQSEHHAESVRSKHLQSAHYAESVYLSDSLPARIVSWVNVLVASASTAALAFHFLASHPGQPATLTPAVIAAVLSLIAAVVMFRHPQAAARIITTRPGAQLAILGCAVVLVADPAAQLWWPAAALLMLLVPVAPTRRILIFCVIAGLVSAGTQLVVLGPARAFSVPNATVWFSLLVPPFAALIVIRAVIRAALGIGSAATFDEPESAASSHRQDGDASDKTPDQLASGYPTGDPASGYPTSGVGALTSREREVVALLAKGLAPKQIAMQRGISLATVRSVLKMAKRKTGARTLSELVGLSIIDGRDVSSRDTGPVAAAIEQLPIAGSGHLTARQLQVVALLADGMRFNEIAVALAISTSAVHRHVMRARERAGVSTTAELVALAISEGVVPSTRG